MTTPLLERKLPQANEHLSWLGERASDLNNPMKWWKTLNPPLFNRKRFQRRIDDITELTVRGQSKILLHWAWESSYEMFGKLRQRYCFLTLPVNGKDVEFSIPRFVIEERIEPEQIRDSWESTRYVLDPGTVVNDVGADGKVKKVIHAGDKLDKGPCPREWFRNLWVIADHDSLCCQKADQMGRVCWGYYRHPDDRDIKRVERIHAMKLKDETFNQSPFEVLTPETLEQSGKSFFVQHTQEVKVQSGLEFERNIHDVFQNNEYSLAYEGPRYHFGSDVQPYKRTNAGLYVPNN